MQISVSSINPLVDVEITFWRYGNLLCRLRTRCANRIDQSMEHWIFLGTSRHRQFVCDCILDCCFLDEKWCLVWRIFISHLRYLCGQKGSAGLFMLRLFQHRKGEPFQRLEKSYYTFISGGIHLRINCPGDCISQIVIKYIIIILMEMCTDRNTMRPF